MKTIDLQTFLDESTIELHVLEQWIERRWIVPPAGAAPRVGLSDIDAARAVFIRDLRADFGVNDEGVDIVLHLVDQLHGLRRLLGDLRVELDAARADPRDGGGD